MQSAGPPILDGHYLFTDLLLTQSRLVSFKSVNWKPSPQFERLSNLVFFPDCHQLTTLIKEAILTLLLPWILVSPFAGFSVVVENSKPLGDNRLLGNQQLPCDLPGYLGVIRIRDLGRDCFLQLSFRHASSITAVRMKG